MLLTRCSRQREHRAGGVHPGQARYVTRRSQNRLVRSMEAKVLEVRALDPEHVYIRVAWLNRPEDLAGGRQPHHGKNELIPTNQLDIIDAMVTRHDIVLKWS